jgi:hypothetical protein
VCNLGSIAFVVHEKKLKFPDVIDQEFLVAVGEDMAGLLVTAITNLIGYRWKIKR